MSLVTFIQQQSRKAKWVGILLIVTGFLSLLAPLAAGLSITFMVGALLIFSGVAQGFLAFRTGSFGAGFLLVLLALISIAAGIYTFMQPAAALATLTLFLAGYFIASGIIGAIGAFGARPESGWGWLLFSGILSVVLGVMIWLQFPLSGVWALGTLVGVQLIMSGWTLIAIGGLAGGSRADDKS